MRRLSVAQDRELRHIADKQVGWRLNWSHLGWYPWCRVCGRDARRQVDALIAKGYIQAPGPHSAPVNVLAVLETIKPYLERYPR